MKKLLSIIAVLAFTATTFAQIETPQASPLGKMEQMVGLTNVTVEYSRPSARGREIFGGLVPYGEKWRTGANKNTTISFSDPVKINGKVLEAGSYAIFTIPQENKWEVIFYNDTNNWGLPEKWDAGKVALKVDAETTKMPMKMETFTIVIDELNNNSAALNFLWDDTLAILKLEVPTAAKAMASINKVMAGPTGGDYYSAASYYFDEGKDLEKALEWITIAVEKNPEAFYMFRKKSLIEAKLGKKDAAIKSAKKSLEAAKNAGNKDYIKMNEESLREWGA